ncbi:dihydroxyacetone phosphate acyltransferase [Macrosteles quadrilineatus]|uniref:dihydroxyacetone phosphate acyltransferase n=1 Tax=Macrosteles quadrilineatus TaxID=74068 RepID=UPI0023E0E775|nr:dihydroxyacetone phosphate acyltransferase [Macrosteles quadrilineatus]
MECIRAHERPSVTFTDILKERHEESDFMWVSREFNWTKAYSLNKNMKNPSYLQKEVLKSQRILRLINEEAKERNVQEKVIYQEVESILEEISCSKQLPIVRWLGYILLKIMKRTMSALYVNEERLLKLKAEMGTNPVLFVPSHRSYADFILMAFVMFHYSVDIPCVAAGMDFHSMWLMGKLLRDCSAFFMRRSFGDDKLYRTVFDEYVNKLVTQGEAPVEFFIEGTRSRSSKSLAPKYGLLTMVMDAFYSGQVPDITIVPVNISYDRTLEEVLFAYEMLGIAKPKESTSGLIKGINMLDERYGNVYVHFCEPISAHQYVWQMSGGQVKYVSRSLQQEQLQIMHLAHDIVDRQQKHSILSCFNVFSLVLSNHIVSSDSPLLLSKAAEDLAWLSSVLSVMGAYVKQDGNTLESLKQAISVHKSLVRIEGENIHLVSVHSPHYKIDPGRIKGHRLGQETMCAAVPLLMLQQYVNSCMHFIVGPAIYLTVCSPSPYVTAVCQLLHALHCWTRYLSDCVVLIAGHRLGQETMCAAVPLLMLQQYVNSCMHFIVGPAIITVVMQHMGESGYITKRQLFEKYQFLRRLLSQEFVLFKEWEVKEFEEALQRLELVNIIESAAEDQLTLGNHRKLQLMLCNLLYPFLSGYLSITKYLLQMKPEMLNEKVLVQGCQGKIEADLQAGHILSPYSLSLDMISCALSSLSHLQALTRARRNGEVNYKVMFERLDSIVNQLGELVVRPQMETDFLQLSSKHSLVDPTAVRAKL